MHTAIQPATRVRAFPLSKGDIGIAQTVATMQQLIETGTSDPSVREKAIEIARYGQAQPRDAHSEIRAIFDWVKHNFRFTKDPSGRETLGTAEYLIRLKAGDCDDYVVTQGALLGALGYPTRIVTIAADPHERRRLSHVYLEVLVNGHWIAMDPTQEHAIPGWAPPKYFRKKVWGPMIKSRRLRPVMSGMGAYTGLGFDYGALATTIAGAGQAAANIITAARIPSQYIYPGTFYQQPGVTATGGVNVSAPGLPEIPAWAWLLFGGAVLLLVMKR
jgi:predicted transglutaminase-like cysteine proteinase